MRIIMIIVMFFVISALFIISNNNLYMYKQESIVKFVDLYLDWINQVFSNSQRVTGEVIRLEWLPENSSNSSQKFK